TGAKGSIRGGRGAPASEVPRRVRWGSIGSRRIPRGVGRSARQRDRKFAGRHRCARAVLCARWLRGYAHSAPARTGGGRAGLRARSGRGGGGAGEVPVCSGGIPRRRCPIGWGAGGGGARDPGAGGEPAGQAAQARGGGAIRVSRETETAGGAQGPVRGQDAEF